MSRNLRRRSISPATLPVVVIIAQDKGGEGKSLAAVAIADRARLSGVPVGVVQVDDQGRLPLLLGPKVVTIKIDPRLMRRDPSAEVRSFTPLYDTIEKMARAGGLTIVDLGANTAPRTALWAGMVDLDEEVREMGASTLIITPVGATAESLRLGARAATAFLDRMPSARLALIENERDGTVATLHPASDAAAAYRDAILPLKTRAMTLRMPLIEGASWRVFEAVGVRPIDVVSMAVADIMALTGLPRPEAKIARGDIAAWMSVVCDELDKVIVFDRESSDDV